jgi:[ribosomal protein S18]-alanine N-acetyltransferase
VPNVTVERLTSLDELDGVLAVEHVSFTNPWTREMYVADLKNEEVSFVYLARDEARRIIGFCSFWRVFEELHINNVAVLPEHRRSGVARRMLTAVLADGSRAGARRALLEVRRSNVAARQLYEELGFSVAGVRRDYYSHPVEDALVLWRENIAAP